MLIMSSCLQIYELILRNKRKSEKTLGISQKTLTFVFKIYQLWI